MPWQLDLLDSQNLKYTVKIRNLKNMESIQKLLNTKYAILKIKILFKYYIKKSHYLIATR